MNTHIAKSFGNALLRSVFSQPALVTALAVAPVAIPQIAAAADDALAGTWNFVPDKSSFKPGPARYKDLKLTVTPQGEMTIEGTDAAGKPVKITYQVVTDGKPHPVTGMSTYDNATWNSFSPTATGYIYMKGKNTVALGSRILSRDGGVLTFSEKSVDGRGKETSNTTMVFTKPGYQFASAPKPAAPTLTGSPFNAEEAAAVATMEKGDDEGAIAAFTKIIDSKQNSRMMYYDHVARGIIYAKKGMNEQAIADFDEALKLKPDDTDARFRRAGTRLQLKQYDGAIEDFSEVVKADPMNAMAYRLRGFAYNTQGKDKLAGADYDQACMLNKDLCQN
jgi:tetratricopeptide repeat protein